MHSARKMFSKGPHFFHSLPANDNKHCELQEQQQQLAKRQIQPATECCNEFDDQFTGNKYTIMYTPVLIASKHKVH